MASRAPAAISLEAFGVHVTVSVDDPSLLPRVHSILPPGWREPASTTPDARFALITLDGGEVAVTHDDQQVAPPAAADVAIESLDAKVRLHIAQHAPGWTFVHAGAVAVEGRAIVIPGRSFAGKTTLVRALIEQGADYLSDEYAVFDPEGLVHPYPKPLSIRPGDGSFRGVDTPASSFGARTGDRAVRVGLVAATRYVEGAQWAPEQRTPAQGALLLLEHAVAARDDPARVLRDLRAGIDGAAILEGDRGEASGTASALLRAVA
jgi:hypothetical protein